MGRPEGEGLLTCVLDEVRRRRPQARSTGENLGRFFRMVSFREESFSLNKTPRMETDSIPVSLAHIIRSAPCFFKGGDFRKEAWLFHTVGSDKKSLFVPDWKNVGWKAAPLLRGDRRSALLVAVFPLVVIRYTLMGY